MTNTEEHPPDQDQSQEVRIAVGGGLVVPTQPEEVGYPLRREIFDLLCEGESARKDERARDVCISISATSLLSLCTLLVTVDWESMQPFKNWLGFLLVILLVAVFLATTGLSYFFHRRVGQHPESSGYARVKQKITDWFEQRGQ